MNARTLLLGNVLRRALLGSCCLACFLPVAALSGTTYWTTTKTGGTKYGSFEAAAQAICDAAWGGLRYYNGVSNGGQVQCASYSNSADTRWTYYVSDPTECPVGNEFDGTECSVPPPPPDCSASAPIRHCFPILNADGSFAPLSPSFVSDGGCQFAPGADFGVGSGAPANPSNWDVWVGKADGATYKCADWYPTGSASEPTDGVPLPSVPGGGSKDTTEPAGSSSTTAPPVVQPDTPSPGDTTSTETRTDTTTWFPATKVDEDTSTDTVTITTDSGVSVTKTTTTTTATYSDGSSTTTTTTEYSQSPQDITRTRINQSGTSQTRTSYPPKTGSTTTQTDTAADGSSATTTTGTGAGGDGTGATDTPNEDEAQGVFAPGPRGDQPSFAESADGLFAKIQSAPIVQAFSGSYANPTGSCPPFTIDTGPIAGVISTTLHCEVWDAVKSVLAVLMLALWGFIGIRIIGSA